MCLANVLVTVISLAGVDFNFQEWQAPRRRAEGLGEVELAVAEGNVASQRGKVAGQYRGFDAFLKGANTDISFLSKKTDERGLRESDLQSTEQSVGFGLGYLHHLADYLGFNLDAAVRLSYQHSRIKFAGYESWWTNYYEVEKDEREIYLTPEKIDQSRNWQVAGLALGLRYYPSVSWLKNLDWDFQHWWENQPYSGLLSADANRTQSYDDRTRFDFALDTGFGLHGGVGVYTFDSKWRPVGEIGFRWQFGFDFLIKSLRVELDPSVAYLDNSVNPFHQQIEYRLGFQFSRDGRDILAVKAQLVDFGTLGIKLTVPLSGNFKSGLSLEAGFQRTRHTYCDGLKGEVTYCWEPEMTRRYKEVVGQQVMLGLTYQF